jgi:hypothetical protein
MGIRFGRFALAAVLCTVAISQAKSLPLPVVHGNSFEIITNSRYSVHYGFDDVLSDTVLSNVLWAMSRVPSFGSSYREIYVATDSNVYIYDTASHVLNVHRAGDHRYIFYADPAFEVGISVERNEEAGLMVQAGLLAGDAFWSVGYGYNVTSCPTGSAVSYADTAWDPNHTINLVEMFGRTGVAGLTDSCFAHSSDSTLPDPVTDGADTFELLVNGLVQDSTFNSTSLSLSTISQLLWAGYGVTAHITTSGNHRGLTVPSAGPWYFLTHHVYLVSDTAVMRYHNRVPPDTEFNSSDHRLEMVTSGDHRDSLRAACPSIPTTAPVYIVVCASDTAVYWMLKLQEAGYAGFQYLMEAHALGLHGRLTAPIQPSEQAEIIDALGLPATDLPVLIFAVGEPAAAVTQDVGVQSIVAPVGAVDSGATVTPQARVRNYGTSAASFPVKFRIGSSYADSQYVTSLAPDSSALVSFATWTAGPRGTHAARCTTSLAADQNHTNDTLSGSVTVQVKDIGIVSINRPAGSYGQGEVVTPAATIRNYGNVPAGFEVWMLLKTPTGALYYSDSVNVANLDPANNRVVDAFLPCTLRVLGDWTAKCSVALSGDLRLDNNVMSRGFKVRTPWIEREPLPGPPSNLAAKDGAWLAYDSGSGLVFAAKGNKSSDFYSYNIPDSDWTSLRAIPPGLESKLPRQGACGTSDGAGHIYMAKGNNTLGFWRYTIATDSWLQLADVPAGASQRRVKAGSGAVYVQIGDSGFVYLLKGPTCEFYRFNVATGTWQTLASAPAGSYAKWYDGSFLVFDGDQTIYAHKARYHELWTYDVSTATWGSTQLSGMPFIGRDASSRKSGGGGCGAWFEDGLYALKGGSTSEFWRYDATADTWTEFNQLPPLGSYGRVRKTSAGGSMVSVDGTLFALKGNQTYEFWRYSLVSLKALQILREGVMAAQTTLGSGRLTIGPSPLVGGRIHLDVGKASSRSATVRLYDASGRSVAVWKPVLHNGAADLDVRHLTAGVYVVRVETNGYYATQKLVVER